MHSIYCAYAETMQTQLREFGCTLSSNGRSNVSINEVFDHLDIPYYPKTSVEGVAHFIHFSEALLTPDTPKNEVFRIAKEQMSKVCQAYADAKLFTYFFRSSFLIMRQLKGLQSCLSSKKVISLITCHISAQESSIANMLTKTCFAYARHMMMSSLTKSMTCNDLLVSNILCLLLQRSLGDRLKLISMHLWTIGIRAITVVCSLTSLHVFIGKQKCFLGMA